MADGAKILMFAGPSGGHLFPAVAVAEKLREKYPSARLWLVTSRKGAEFCARFPESLFEGIFYLPNFPSPAGFSWGTFSFVLKLAAAFTASLRIVRKIRPSAVFGFGSYVSFPGVMAGRLLKIPVIIHEQNRVPGKATAWSLRYANTAAVSFPETFSGRNLPDRVVTGLPLRRSLVQASKDRFERKDGFTLLVSGGSQGARMLNRKILEAFSLMDPEEKKRIAVIHITGKSGFEEVSRGYAERGLKPEIYPFFEKMELLYVRADAAITRAGANTVFELALFGIPAILIPYPLAGGHQRENARYFEDRGAAICLEESSMGAEDLYRNLKILMQNVTQRRGMSEAMRDLAGSQAADQLADMAVKASEKERLTWVQSGKT